MAQGFFVTGTDTDVGKTWVTVALLRYFKRQGKAVIGMKPVAAGCELLEGQLKNSDALLLQAHSSVAVDYRHINPYAYALPVSPHIAGAHQPVVLEVILEHFQILQSLADVVVVEGAGGWYSPLNAQQDNAALAGALKLPVILVVAIRLGCINHARLSMQAIMHSGLLCAGWVAVCLDPNMLVQTENIAHLTAVLDVPLLGVMPYLSEVDIDFGLIV